MTEVFAGIARVAGVDEVGRGPLAGPVVAAAVILPPTQPIGLADSKTLSPARRHRLDLVIRASSDVSIALASVAEIDRLNILEATMLAMQRAVEGLPEPPGAALVDGNRLPDLACPARAIVKGDASQPAIAAASIVAKQARDAMMRALAAAYPGYGWERNAGYGTREHKAALSRLGPSPEHRRSFAPVRAVADM